MELKLKVGIIILSFLLIFGLIFDYIGSNRNGFDHKIYEELRPYHAYKNITILYSADDAKNKTEEYLREYQKSGRNIIEETLINRNITNYTVVYSKIIKSDDRRHLCKEYFEVKIEYDFYYLGDKENIGGIEKGDSKIVLCDDGQISEVVDVV